MVLSAFKMTTTSDFSLSKTLNVTADSQKYSWITIRKQIMMCHSSQSWSLSQPQQEWLKEQIKIIAAAKSRKTIR
jgi:hypothetical protein